MSHRAIELVESYMYLFQIILLALFAVTNSRDLKPAPGCKRENFLRQAIRVHISSIASSFSSSSELLHGSTPVVALSSVMLQLWRFSALIVSLSLSSLIRGDDTAQHVLSENSKLSNDSLLWGPYRPNLYFGVRPRIPKSLMTGLVWAKVDSFQGVQNSKCLRAR